MTPKLDNIDLRNRFLDQIRAGFGKYEAARIVGIDTETFRFYYKANADFREEVANALDASVEPVLKMLRDEGLAGDITAAKEWLKHAAPPPRSEQGKNDVNVQVVHEIDPATISSIADLRARLEGRSRPELTEEIIDAEIIED